MTDSIRETLVADILRATAQATTLDLSIAPMVIGAPVDFDMARLMIGIANGMGLEYHEFSMNNDEVSVDERNFFKHSLAEGKPLILGIAANHVLDKALFQGVVQGLQDDAWGNVIVLAYGRFDQVDVMLSAIHSALDVHPALVPTATIVEHPSHRRHQIVGRAGLEGSKCGLRFLEIEASEPYEHMVRVTVQALDDQDDDAMNEALDNILGVDREIAIRARVENGSLVCTTDDMVSLG